MPCAAGHYQGRAFANELAFSGFVLLAHDVYGCGSRRFGLDDMPALIRRIAAATQHIAPPDAVPGEVPAEVGLVQRRRVPPRALDRKVLRAAGHHPGRWVSDEDRVAAAYLRAAATWSAARSAASVCRAADAAPRALG